MALARLPPSTRSIKAVSVTLGSLRHRQGVLTRRQAEGENHRKLSRRRRSFGQSQPHAESGAKRHHPEQQIGHEPCSEVHELRLLPPAGGWLGLSDQQAESTGESILSDARDSQPQACRPDKRSGSQGRWSTEALTVGAIGLGKDLSAEVVQSNAEKQSAKPDQHWIDDVQVHVGRVSKGRSHALVDVDERIDEHDGL